MFEESLVFEDPSSAKLRLGVVMAGGAGERFWPLSRAKRPKQLLSLAGKDRTLLEEAIARLLPLIPAERVFLATNRLLYEVIKDFDLGLPEENILLEPVRKNTAGCLAYVSACCLHRFGDMALEMTLAITTADHFIGDDEAFHRTVLTALEVVEREDCLGLIGIKPTRPETGFGYIEVPRDARPISEGADAPPVFRVERFREKPDRQTAEEFIACGRFYWNSGMFFWKLGTFLSELEKVQPEMVRIIHNIADALRHDNEEETRRFFEKLEDISIDYALMEHTRNVVVVAGNFPWDDLGSWESLERFYPRDEKGNVILGNPVVIDCERCIVHNEAAERIALAVMGAKDLVIVATEDAVLVVPKERGQDVRLVVNELKQRQAKQI